VKAAAAERPCRGRAAAALVFARALLVKNWRIIARHYGNANKRRVFILFCRKAPPGGDVLTALPAPPFRWLASRAAGWTASSPPSHYRVFWLHSSRLYARHSRSSPLLAANFSLTMDLNGTNPRVRWDGLRLDGVGLFTTFSLRLPEERKDGTLDRCVSLRVKHLQRFAYGLPLTTSRHRRHAHRTNIHYACRAAATILSCIRRAQHAAAYSYSSAPFLLLSLSHVIQNTRTRLLRLQSIT